MAESNVQNEYARLQTLFQTVYALAKEKHNKKILSELTKQRKDIASAVSKYQKNPSASEAFAKAVIDNMKMLSQLQQEIQKEPEAKTKKQKKKKIAKEAEEIKKSLVERAQMSSVPTRKSEPKGEIVETYEIEVDGARVQVEIEKRALGTHYNLIMPKLNPPTMALLGEIKNELISITPITMKELADPKSLTFIKERFMQEASSIIKQKLPNVNEETERFLVGHLMQEMVGLGNIEFLINDAKLEEIVIISAKEPIRVYTKKHGWLLTNIRVEKEEDIVNYANIIARRVGRQINVLSPLLDAHLVTGDRVNAVLYPINTKGSTITIRKFARDPYTIIDLIKNKTCDLDTAAILWIAIEYEMNVIISGGTAAGKTVFLNSCLPFIPPDHRILSIEDTRELMLPDFLYWTPLTTRTPNPEGKGAVSMLDLLINSLRMRPDRIILGEMRKHEEAMVLFEAMHTGHSVYATVHADSAAETISRLVNPPLSVPHNLLRAVNLNVVMHRDRRKGTRRIAHIAEIEAGGDSAKANILYRWSAEADKIVRHSESSRFFEELNRHTGMTDKEIEEDLEDKKAILTWLMENEVRDLQSFGKVMHNYYKNRPLMEEARKTNNIELLTGSRVNIPQKRQEDTSKESPKPKHGKKKSKKQ